MNPFGNPPESTVGIMSSSSSSKPIENPFGEPYESMEDVVTSPSNINPFGDIPVTMEDGIVSSSARTASFGEHMDSMNDTESCPLDLDTKVNPLEAPTLVSKSCPFEQEEKVKPLVAPTLVSKMGMNRNMKENVLASWLRGNRAADGVVEESSSNEDTENCHLSVTQSATNETETHTDRSKLDTITRMTYLLNHNRNNNDSKTCKSDAPTRTQDAEDVELLNQPSDLPSIHEEVLNLELWDFEAKAEERSITIIGNWLFHVGGEDMPLEQLRVETFTGLELVNARLHDRVRTSSAEVQELVSTVSTIQTEMAQLSSDIQDTYMSSGPKKSTNECLLSNYVRIKGTLHARRNLLKCFRELEFFAHIPATCDRLREELHQGEWTAHEYTTIRKVCMEHVELEILLVEAQAGMKARVKNPQEYDRGMSNMSNWASSRRFNHEMIDQFLSKYVKNVWELGEEIRLRVLSGIGSAFDLALQDPTGMVALVESVEVYERAAEQYEALNGRRAEATHTGNGNIKNSLQFTNMRASALTTLFRDFERRGREMFRDIHKQQAVSTGTVDDQDNDQTLLFNGVLSAATELVTEIDVVKNRMAPCFAPHWRVEMLWSSCVAHVCSNQIMQQIGGLEGTHLPNLSVTQLLDLVAWVEFFRDSIEDAFPYISSMHAEKTYFNTKPDLFDGDQNKEVNMTSAMDRMAWVNNMLWKVHMLAQDEFLLRTRTQIEEWLSKIYISELGGHETSEGRLMTTLCEDIFGLVSVQFRTIRERLSKKSEALVMAVCQVLSELKMKQIHARDTFLIDLETCCAAANDFQRMSEKTEDILQELIDECEFPHRSVSLLKEHSNELIALYSSDAVFAAQKAHVYIFHDIEDNITDLFDKEWEIDLTNNERAISLTQTLEDFMQDLEQFLDDFMLKKTVDALITASVLFYIRSLLHKGEHHSSNRVSWFNDNEIALQRMDGDISVIREYFEGLMEGMPALAKVIEVEFELISSVHELLRIAAGFSDSDASDFIPVVYKRIKDVDIMKHFIGDLWHLVKPTQERMVWELVESLEDTLVAVYPPNYPVAGTNQNRMNVPGLMFDEMLANLYIKSQRRHTVKPGSMETLVNNWKKNWVMEQ